MPAGCRWPILAAVEDRTITITLELRVAGESLTGSATEAGGAAREFSGWLGLVSALDALVPSAPPLPPRAGQTPNGDIPGGTNDPR